MGGSNKTCSHLEQSVYIGLGVVFMDGDAKAANAGNVAQGNKDARRRERRKQGAIAIDSLQAERVPSTKGAL